MKILGSLYHVSMHEEKASPDTNVGTHESGLVYSDNAKSRYKVNDLIHSTQENDKKILGITGKTLFSEIIPTDKEKKEKASAPTRATPESAYGGRAVTPDAVSAGKDNTNNPSVQGNGRENISRLSEIFTPADEREGLVRRDTWGEEKKEGNSYGLRKSSLSLQRDNAVAVSTLTTSAGGTTIRPSEYL